MAVDENGNPIIETTPKPNRAEERITELSEKVKEEATAREAAEKKVAEAERKAQFAEGFADVLGTHPAAKEHKADIEAKVVAGYSVEDATYAVLGKAGKLGTPATPAPGSPAGGSAATTPTQTGNKEIKDMSLAEKREILEKNIMWT
jgi:hypothetical protein